MLSKLILVVAALLAGTAGAVPLPLKINFQGKLLDPATDAPRNGNVDFTFRICNDPTSACTVCPGSVCLWQETQGAVPVSNGVFSVQLGSKTAILPDMLAGASAYLSVTASPDASEMTPRQQLVMSPYAYTAAQLVQSGDIRVNAGSSFSTFTAAGSLQLAAGIVAATGTFVNVTATSGTFTATGSSQYSVQTSSGIRVLAGTLRVEGAGGISVQDRVSSAYYSGDAADLSNVRVKLSSASANDTVSPGAATEVVAAIAVITPSRTNSRILIQGVAGLNRAVNNVTTWNIRIRRDIGAACTVGSAQVGFTLNHTVYNSAGASNLVSIVKVDAPSTTSDVWYCLTLTPGAAQSFDERTLVLTEAAP
jgi:hypothetical protein